MMLSFLLLLPLLYFILKQMTKTQSPPLPPGPTPWPILATINYFHKPITHIDLAKLAQSHGPLMLLRHGTQNLVVGSSPAAALQILKTNDRILSARSIPHSVPLTEPEINKLSFWADPNSDHWKVIRTVCRTELFSAKAMECQEHLREQKMVEMLDKLRSRQGVVTNVQQIVFSTVINMFSNVFFSRDIVGMENDCEMVRGLLRGFIEAISAPNLSDLYPFLWKLDPHGLRRKHRDMSIKMWALWEPLLKERRTKADMGGELRDQDFLNILISRGFTDDQINKLIEELFQAGIDTTTSTINRTMVELLMNTPQSLTKLKQELEAVLSSNQHPFRDFNLEQLPYLDATIKETLRLHPPAPLLLSHRATQACQVMNHTVPKNAKVLVNVWAIGRDPTVWEDPLEYRPERFLINSSRDLKGNDFEFLPFGAGRRICPGLPMAAKIVPLFVASLVYHFDWSVPHDGAVDHETLRATSKMKQPLLLIPTARK